MSLCRNVILFVERRGSNSAHLLALRGRAPSPLHRRSFSPVRCSLGEEDDDEALLQLLGIDAQEPG